MTGEKNKVTVMIRNKEYTIIANETTEYILSVAEEFNGRILQISDGNTMLNPEKITILAALNLCDDYLKIRQANSALQRQVMKCAKDLEKAQEELATVYNVDDNSDGMRREIVNYSKELGEAKKSIEEMKKQSKTTEELEAKHKQELDALRAEFEQKEREMLDMIDKM